MPCGPLAIAFSSIPSILCPNKLTRDVQLLAERVFLPRSSGPRSRGVPTVAPSPLHRRARRARSFHGSETRRGTATHPLVPSVVKRSRGTAQAAGRFRLRVAGNALQLPSLERGAWEDRQPRDGDLTFRSLGCCQPTANLVNQLPGGDRDALPLEARKDPDPRCMGHLVHCPHCAGATVPDRRWPDRYLYPDQQNAGRNCCRNSRL